MSPKPQQPIASPLDDAQFRTQPGVAGDAEKPADSSAASALTAPVDLPLALIIEDEETVGYLLAFILEREGFKVEWKKNGRDADHFIHCGETPHIVLLDISLPDIDGYGLLDRIRDRLAWEHVPVLMLTSMSEAKYVVKAMACGANDYLLKPFHPAELLKRVHKLSSRPKPQVASQPNP